MEDPITLTGTSPPSALDVVVIGAGILGLATARRLLLDRPSLRVLVVEKEAAVARHQTGRNSGVVHRGVYYAPGSLKARLCVRGADQLTAYCDARGIPWQRTGKVIVALDTGEIPALHELMRRAVANGVEGAELIGPDRLRELEPAVNGVAAIHSPATGTVDYVAVARALADDVIERGGEILFGAEVQHIDARPGEIAVETTRGSHRARSLISCAGLQSDRVAGMTDRAARHRLRIVPFRGDYYVVRPERAHLCRSLIYPVPDPTFPFLGVHFTRRHDGTVWAGPNAVFAFARERYRRTDVRLADTWDSLSFRGFWRVALRHWRTGLAEQWRDVSRAAFASALRRYVPEIAEDDLLPGPAGIRAQAVGLDGSLVDDFRIDAHDTAIHVRNAPSPAATSSLAIADLIAAAWRARVDA